MSRSARNRLRRAVSVSWPASQQGGCRIASAMRSTCGKRGARTGGAGSAPGAPRLFRAPLASANRLASSFGRGGARMRTTAPADRRQLEDERARGLGGANLTRSSPVPPGCARGRPHGVPAGDPDRCASSAAGGRRRRDRRPGLPCRAVRRLHGRHFGRDAGRSRRRAPSSSAIPSAARSTMKPTPRCARKARGRVAGRASSPSCASAKPGPSGSPAAP